jgi:two-component system nitrogen regulation sensor histidine kinase NtrY
MKIYKVILILLLLVLFISVNVFLFARFTKLGNEPLYALLFLAGINLNLLALLILVFYVGKNIIRLYIERKKNIPGHRFQIQLVSIFVILTLIPGVFLFIIGSGLVTGYIERWLTPQSLSSLEDLIKLAKIYYEEKKESLRTEGLRLKTELLLTPSRISLNSRNLDMARLPSQKVSNWEILSVSDSGEIVTSSGRSLKNDDLLKEALSKGEATDVYKGPDGEYIRVALAIPVNGKRNLLLGSLKVPAEITELVERLKNDYEDASMKLKWKFPLKVNFILTFGFFTLLIIMLALWTGLKISKRITEPVKELTEATMEVASGNLDVKIKHGEGRNDEISYLIRNFNIMIEELRDSKRSLHNAYIEAEGQRLRLSSILENINTGVLFINDSGIIISMNSAAERILSISQGEYLGKHYRELIEYIGSEELEALIKSIRIKDLKGIEREIRLTLKERPFILRVFITSLRLPAEAEKQPVGLIVVFDDITDIVNAQKAIAWQEIASRIAHEVKNPLTPIKLSTERLIKKWQNRESDFDEVFESSTRTIIKEVESLRKLVSDFSQFGRLPQINKRRVDLRGVLKDVYDLYRGFKDIRFHLECPEEPVMVEIDAEQIKRVVINIVDNAVEALTDARYQRSEVGNITIKLYEESERIVISISDDGPGISDDIKDKLFMPHFTTKKGGSGLGLAIAQRIVTEHRGFIKVKDNFPKGSVFLIELPQRG